MTQLPEQFFDDLLRADPTRPFVTCYDEATGERQELSARSMANWVAKTYSYLTDELALGPGDVAAITTGTHWITVPMVLGALSAGLALDTSPDTTPPADVTFGDIEDYIAAVRPQPDQWQLVDFQAGPDDPCLPGLTRAQVFTAARDAASAAGLGERARVLVTRQWREPQDWIETLLAPLSVLGSVVLVLNCTDDSTLQRRADTERVTNQV